MSNTGTEGLQILQCTKCGWLAIEGYGSGGAAPMWRHVMLKHVPKGHVGSKAGYWRHLYRYGRREISSDVSIA